MAGEKLGEAVLELSTDDKNLTSGITQAEKKAKALQKSFEAVGKKLTVALTLPIAALGAGMVAAADKQMQAEAALTNAIKATGRQAEISLASLKGYAASLQRVTKYGDETQLSALAMVQQLANLDEQGLKKVLPGMLDFATAMGVDLQTAASLVGKTLGSTTNALARYGIEVDATADPSKKLAQLTEQLAQKFDGAAEAAANVGLGPLVQLKNALGDVGEQFGTIIIPHLIAFVEKLGEVVDWLSSLSDEQRKTIITIAAFAAAIGPVLLITGKLIGAFGLLKIAVLKLNTAVLANPYVVAAAAAIALGVAIFALTKNLRQEAQERKDLQEKVEKGIELSIEEKNRLGELEIARLKDVRAMRMRALESAKSLGQSQAAIDLLQKNVDTITGEIAAYSRALALQAQADREAAKAKAEHAEATQDLTDATEALAEAGGGAGAGDGGDTGPWISGSQWIKGMVDELAELQEGIEKHWSEGFSGYSGQTGGEGVSSEGGGITDILQSVGTAFGNMLSPLGGMIGALSSVQMILNPIATILQGVMNILGPAIDKVLAPLIGILLIVGETIGQILMPILDALMPIIELLAKAFVWFYNKIIVPVGTFLMKVFTTIGNALIGIVNGVITAINGLLPKSKKIALLSKMDTSAAALQAITYDEVAGKGAAAVSTANADAEAAASAAYTQVRPIENNFYIEGNSFNGAGGLREFVIMLDTEWRSANALGLV